MTTNLNDQEKALEREAIRVTALICRHALDGVRTKDDGGFQRAIDSAIDKINAVLAAVRTATAPAPIQLPNPDAAKRYIFPDGCIIWPAGFISSLGGRWLACWADKTLLRGDNDDLSTFATPEEAAAALAAGGEGPAAYNR